MKRLRSICLLTALCCLAGLAAPSLAAEVSCDSVYCFTPGDFSGDGELSGICILSLPDASAGTAMLGSRILRCGDILTAEQVGQMTFVPLRTDWDRDAVVTYLPVYEDRVAPEATMTISIRGKQDKAPVAEDSAAETYKNLPNEGSLKVTDPEGEALTYTLVRGPKRGEVILREDGSFLYTPKKNKVGTDSFTYTATDPAGNVSREATVTVRIMKPTDSRQYTDTAGESCRFAAEWMRNTGIFSAEQVGGEHCFYPGQTVTQGQFLTMVMRMLEIPVDESATVVGYLDDAPAWLKPYLAAALRSGLLEGIPDEDEGAFRYNEPVTGAQAAVMLNNAMDLSAGDTDAAEDVPTWASSAVSAMNAGGIAIGEYDALTRSQVAQILYAASLASADAPGLAVIPK